MPRTPKNDPAAESKPPNLSYEDALKKLEGLVEEMESGELPLESLLTRFEEGTKLAQLCQSKLAEAEAKILQLEEKPGGDLELKPFDTTPDVNP